MKTIVTFFVIFLIQVSVCFAQTRTSVNIPFQYCCSNLKIRIDDKTEAHIEGYSQNDITGIIVSIDFTDKSNRQNNVFYLTTGAPYPKGTQLKTEQTGRSESYIKLMPLNIDRYWQGNKLTIFVTIMYDRTTIRNNSFTFGRADSRNKEAIKTLDSICPKTPVPPVVKYVKPKERLIIARTALGVYPNQDSYELLKAFNPDLFRTDTVKTTETVRMPPFPAVTFAQRSSARKQYKESRKPDAAISEQYNQSAAMLSQGISSFREKKFPGKNASTQILENKLAEINYYCSNIKPYSRKIGRKTMHFLNQQTEALNAILQKSVNKSRINDDEIRDCNLLMDNIYMNVKKIAVRYHVKPYISSYATGYLAPQSSDNTLYASTEEIVPLTVTETAAYIPLPYTEGFDVCTRLTWWERIFRPRTERKFFVYVFKCPDASCYECSDVKGCFNGCEGQYTIIATCIGAAPEHFNGMASVAYNTLTDAKWTFNICTGNTTSSSIQSEDIYTSSATCETSKKQLQLWLKLKP